MEIDKSEMEGIVVFSISGDIDLYNAPTLKKSIRNLLDEKRYKLIINLDRVSYIDSSGIGALIYSYSNLKKFEGSLRLCNMAGSVRKVFELTKLTSFFDIDKTEEASLMALR